MRTLMSPKTRVSGKTEDIKLVRTAPRQLTLFADSFNVSISKPCSSFTKKLLVSPPCRPHCGELLVVQFIQINTQVQWLSAKKITVDGKPLIGIGGMCSQLKHTCRSFSCSSVARCNPNNCHLVFTRCVQILYRRGHTYPVPKRLGRFVIVARCSLGSLCQTRSNLFILPFNRDSLQCG